MLTTKKIRVMILAAAAMVAPSVASFASVNVAIGVSVGTPPPPLPVYAQPPSLRRAIYGRQATGLGVLPATTGSQEFG